MASNSVLRFGISIPQVFPVDKVDLALIKKVVTRAEQLGYDSAWTLSSVERSSHQLDALPLLSYVAAITDRIKLGTSVMMPLAYVPLNMAKTLATLDQLSRGRLIWGIGLGHLTAFGAFGISPERKVERFEEGVQLVKKLLMEDPVTFNGNFWSMENFSTNVRPFQKPRPPIWFGGLAPGALRRAVKLGDGWMGAGYSPITKFREQLKLIRQYLEDLGRDPSTFTLSKRVYIAVEKDRETAYAGLERFFNDIYGKSSIARVTGVRSSTTDATVYGSPEECVEKLASIAAEGLDMILLNPTYNTLEQMERLSKDVIPKLV